MATRTRSGKTTAEADPGLLSIGALAQATSIPVQTLRTWARRYGAPEASRKPSGHRLYPVSMVATLRKVAQLLEQGHRAGELLTRSPEELDALWSLASVEGAAAPAGARRAAIAPVADAPDVSGMLYAAKRLDRDTLAGMLRDAWVALGPVPFLEQCAVALMREVGAAWRDERIDIHHEHFATATLTAFLREVREPFDRRARGPRVIAATLPGDRHEAGLLMASVVLAMHGYRVVYLGADVPVAQLTAAARESAAHAVVVSVSTTLPAIAASRAIAALRTALPRRTALWVGGAGTRKSAKGIERFESLSALDERLTARA